MVRPMGMAGTAVKQNLSSIRGENLFAPYLKILGVRNHKRDRKLFLVPLPIS
jgi:hypothetical protein